MGNKELYRESEQVGNWSLTTVATEFDHDDQRRHVLTVKATEHYREESFTFFSAFYPEYTFSCPAALARAAIRQHDKAKATLWDAISGSGMRTSLGTPTISLEGLEAHINGGPKPKGFGAAALADYRYVIKESAEDLDRYERLAAKLAAEPATSHNGGATE